MLKSIRKAGLLAAALMAGNLASAQLPVSVVSSNITADRTFSNDTIYQLDGFVYVKNNATLTIEAGTVVQGYIDPVFGNAKGTLIITRSGFIDARGTECAPIVFTSANAPGMRGTGDWGGVIILGEATINRGTNMGGYFTDIIEGGLTGDVADRTYGGNNDQDSSGVMQYCRIEFAGIAFTPNNEINSLTTGGVGEKTVIDHIMVSYAGDDAFEMFGGKWNGSHLIAHRTLDDNFDCDQGYRGNIQYGIVYSEANTADISKSEGWETDNWSSNPNQAPRTAPVFSNITLIGPKATGTPNSLHQSAARIRRGAWTSIHNSVMVDHVNGLYIDGDDTYAGWNSGMEFSGNILAGMTDNYKAAGAHSTSDMATLWTASNTNYANTSSVGFNSAYNVVTGPNLVPEAGSVLLSGASWSFTGASDFDQVSYRGALDRNNDWTANWTEWDPQNAVYDVAAPGVDSIVAVNPNKGVYRAFFSNLPSATSYSFEYRAEGASTWKTKSFANSNQSFQTFNVTPSFNANIEYRLGAMINGSMSYSCTETFFNDCKNMNINTVEQSSPFCDGDSALVRVGIAGGYGAKTILWSNGATTKRTYADQGETLTVTVTDASGCSKTASITASSLDVSTTPTGFSVVRDNPTTFTGTWTASSLNPGQTLIGYRMAYRLRNTLNFTNGPLVTGTSSTVDFTGSGLPAGNYEFVVFARYNDNGTPTNSNFTCIDVLGYNGTGNKTDLAGANNTSFIVGIYPNPTSTDLYVAAANGSEVVLMDINGRVIGEKVVTSNEVSFNMSELSEGVYMVRIINGGEVRTEKVVKK